MIADNYIKEMESEPIFFTYKNSTNLTEACFEYGFKELLPDYKLFKEIQYKSNLEAYGITLEENLVNNTGYASLEELYEGSNDQLIEISNFDLVIQAIGQEANLVVTDEVLRDYFMEYYNTDDYSEFEGQYGIEYLRFTILQEVVMEYLVENAELL
jgi:FKBP-type peptidyl-prolyl cis-trans isomerase (trigger factor)